MVYNCFEIDGWVKSHTVFFPSFFLFSQRIVIHTHLSDSIQWDIHVFISHSLSSAKCILYKTAIHNEFVINSHYRLFRILTCSRSNWTHTHTDTRTIQFILEQTLIYTYIYLSMKPVVWCFYRYALILIAR